MPTEQDIKNFTDTVDEAVTYPILTREIPDLDAAVGDTPAVSGPGGTSLTATARQSIRQVLGWRYRSEDPKGFLAALGKAFTLKEVEGHIESEWKPQSYMLQADLGEITGAQASIHKQASVALEHAVPLLDGLKPLRTDADEEDTEALRAIIRTEMQELVNELAMTGGPRVQRVDAFFEDLLAQTPGQPLANVDPEQVAGQLARLRDRFGFQRGRVNTIAEEQNFTNFLILVDYVNSLYQSWHLKRGFFSHTGIPEPFLGTQLVLLSQALDVILEQVRETYAAMDSVFFGPADRQATLLNLPNETPITVAELLGWVETFAAYEGCRLIQDGGKDGVVIFRSTSQRLQTLVDKAATIAAQPAANPARPFHTKRAAIALKVLANYLATARDRSAEISRRPVQFAELEGEEQNLPLSFVGIAPFAPPPPVLFKVDWFARKPSGTNSFIDRKPGDTIRPGDEVKAIVFGRNLRAGLSFDFGDDFELARIEFDSSGQSAVAELKIKDSAKSGVRPLRVKDANKQIHSLADGLAVDACVPQESGTLTVTSFDPKCGRQGERKEVEFTGDDLRGGGVSFGAGIHILKTTYSDEGMEVEIEIDRLAQLGERTVTLFTTDCRSAVLSDKFIVEPAPSSPPMKVTVFTDEDEKPGKETYAEKGPSAAGQEPERSRQVAQARRRRRNP
jgi:hypothetical protein